MVWNGEKAINLKAWKGKVGSTLLEETEVGPGELVEVSGYAGSPHDVTWEIFDRRDERQNRRIDI